MPRTTVIFGAFLLLLQGGSPTLSSGASDEVVALRSLETWRSPASGEATSLSVVEFSCQQESRRVFVSLSEGGDWLFESLVRPGTGYSRLALIHPETGWALSIEDHYEGSIENRSPYMYGDALFWQKLAASDPVDRERTLTVGGDVVATDSTPAPLLMRGDLAGSFPAARMQQVFGERTPPDLVGDLRLCLALIREPEAARGTFSPFITLAAVIASGLDRPMGDDEVSGSPGWERVDIQAFGGSTADRSVEIDLLERFGRSADALAGLHAPPDGGCSDERPSTGNR